MNPNPEMDALKVPILPADEHQSLLSRVKSKLTKRIIIPTVGSGALALGFFTLFCSLNPAPVPVPSSGSLYSVIIDAGSSGSKVHVFKYSIDQSGVPVFNFGVRNYNASPKFIDGLATYANDLNTAKEKVQELVDFAKEKEKVPQGMRNRSDIRLMATAGMRLIDHDDQERILDAAKQVFRSSGFNFRDEWASVISGSDEGMYAWVIANYALRSLGNNALPTKGIVELGGASAQVTFVSRDPLSRDPLVSHGDSHEKSYKSVSYSIYSHSFPGYGKDAALKRLMNKLKNSAVEDEDVEDPCTPEGYIYQNNQQKYLSVFLADESEYTKLKAAGNFTECKTKTLELLQEGNEACPHTDSCPIGSIYTPQLQGNFLATANFFFTSKFFKLKERNWMSELRQKGEVFCQKSWEDLKAEYLDPPKVTEEFLRGYCFSSAYIISMLERLGVNSDRIEVAQRINNISLDWALGAFIDTASQPNVPAPTPAPAPTLTSGNGDNSRKFLGF